MSTWVCLASSCRWLRLPDGAIAVRLRDGRRFECGRGATPMLDALAGGILEQDLEQNYLCEPHCNALWLTLSELRLIEQRSLPRREPVPIAAITAAAAPPNRGAARSWLCLLLVCQMVNLWAASAGLGARLGEAGARENLLGAGIGPVWILLALLAFALHACLHELSHAGMAVAAGVKGRIVFFRDGFWRPRFEAGPQPGLERACAVAAILAGGPLLDMSVMGAALALILSGAIPAAPLAAAWCVAGILATLNMAPVRRTDGNQLLALAALTPFQRHGYVIASTAAGLGLVMTSGRLAGHYLAAGF
ncbi:hypothetical protein Q4S45_15430 [Massilia sp. R2A-15]|uniref:hypothetical protein n=1 Tax=Massilia sp. R2A-15 TaxID=3064278 RepID=UPI002732379D|nr:hypothetical protein [Massilia sp. R2A-15]WLI88122.1 hypothetical protein Q4S45_15430 [Massilia sp. R2A-15]